MFLADLHREVVESIRAHHACGHFDRDAALARLVAAGFTDGQAADMLALPVTPELLRAHTGRKD